MRLLEWFSQGALDGPASPETGYQGRVGNAQPLGPICQQHSLTIVGQANVAATVSRLLGVRRPSAVFGTVRAVVVNSVEGVFRRRARPHVSVEVLEGLPALTYYDPTSAVVGPSRVVAVSAATTHPHPHGMFRKASSRAVGFARCTPGLNAKASTGARAHPKVATADTDDFPAIASARPHQLPDGCWRIGQDDQTTESLAGGQRDTLHGYSEPPIPDAAPRDGANIAGASCVNYTTCVARMIPPEASHAAS